MTKLPRSIFSIFPLFLIILASVLVITNFTPGTYLTGWDTLHPEFNFKLNFWRTFFGVWREEQGVGVVAAHSHMSEIPRIFLLWLASFIFPVSFLRYLYFFITLIIGPLGVYFFLAYVLKKHGFWTHLASFLGASYYLLNLGTLQHYYVPFEMFATQFAALPWLFLFTLKFLNQGRRKHLLALSIISLLATPMAYAATLFYAYLIVLTAFLAFSSILEANKKIHIKRSIAVLGIVLTTNSFWLLPNLYTIVKQGQVIRNSKINKLFSPEAFLRNKEYGSLENILIHKNFLFSWREYSDESNEFVDLLEEWNQYLGQPQVSIVANVIALVFISGVFIALAKRDKIALSLFIPFLISLFFLINDNPPTGPIYSFLYKNELFREGLRTPFTKFSILFMFVASFYFAFALSNLFFLFSKDRWLTPLRVFLGFLSLISLSFVMVPAFKGNLISPSMRIKIPDEYFEVSSWLNQQKQGRVAKLPLHSFWGWIYYDWGFEGAGFNWFDIESPTFDRDFDRWSQYNESFYKEASSALYDKDLQSFEKVLEKYQVRYLFLDESVINPSGDSAATFIPETKELLASSTNLSLVKSFGSLSIYKSDFDFGKNFVWSPKSYSKINADLTYSQNDTIFRNFGTYVDGKTYFPFVNFDLRTGLTVIKEKESVSFSQVLPENIEGILTIPNYLNSADSLVADAYLERIGGNDLSLRLTLYTPEIFLNDNKVSGDETSLTYKISSSDSQNFSFRNFSFIQIGSDVLPVEGKTGYLGRVLINSKDVSLKLYSGAPSKETGFSEILGQSPRLCADPNTKIFLVNQDGNFSFNVQDKSVCWGGGTQISSDALLIASFEAISPENLYPSFCLTKADHEGCANKSLPDKFSKIDGWSVFSFLEPLEAGNFWVDFVGLAQEEGSANISFRNLSFSVYPQIGNYILPISSDLEGLSKNSEIKISQMAGKIKVKIKTKDAVSESAKLGRGYAKALNCDAVKEGTAQKVIEGEKVLYKALDGGVSCDFKDYPNIDLSRAYLLTIEGENVEGRGIKVYLQNRVNKRIELEELLANGIFSESFVLPPKKEGKGYLLNYETRSFGKLPSENYLESITFAPIPFNWLNSLKIKGYEAIEVRNNLAIGDVRKTGTGYYKLLVASPQKEGLIVLGQGYDAGWLALTNIHFPFSNVQLLPHVKVNSWANGFLVPEGQHKVVIIFWPQILEYFGMVLGVGTILILAFKRHQKVSLPL